jgi:hypothetical protein
MDGSSSDLRIREAGRTPGVVSEPTETGNDVLPAIRRGPPRAFSLSRGSEIEPSYPSVRPFHRGDLMKMHTPATHPMARRNGASPDRV